VLGHWRRWRRPDQLRLAGSGVGREVVLGRLCKAAHPSGESGQGGRHRKTSSMTMCGQPEGSGGGGGAASGGRGWQITMQGGRTQPRSARGVVESVEERLERVVHGGLGAAGVEQGGATVRGQRGCRGRSWKGHRGATTQGGARGGDGRAGWWPVEAALGGPGCASWRRHGVRRKQRWRMSR
jgi:hypothetical protein